MKVDYTLAFTESNIEDASTFKSIHHFNQYYLFNFKAFQDWMFLFVDSEEQLKNVRDNSARVIRKTRNDIRKRLRTE